MKYPEVSQQILEMVKIDQEVHMMIEGPVDVERWNKVDSENTENLKRIIMQIGWPTLSKVGEESSEGAWLLAQHADHDVEFQKHCLKLMTVEPLDEVTEIDIAYLYDRISVNEGRPQFFGTQFTNNNYKAHGPEEIELFEFVDERRLSIGLETLYSYQQSFKERYPA